MKIEELKHIHFTGIKGVAMTALALCAQDLGIKVTGSDVEEIFVTDKVLERRKINWKLGFGKKNLYPKPDLLITTGAHGGWNNPEVIEAKNLGIPVITQAKAMAFFSEEKKTISVCGVGGKTTISSMVSTVLTQAEEYPSYAIGVGEIFPIGYPGRYDTKGDYFICEADEFVVSPGVDDTPKFLLLSPFITVVSNIEHDHPDVYPSLEDTKKVFLKFFEKIPNKGILVACADNENVIQLLKQVRVPFTTYGFSKDADYRVESFTVNSGKSMFSLKERNCDKVELELKVPGEYNISNAAATYAVGRFLGLSTKVLKEGILAYKGCKRRFEKIGEKNGITVFDDYAHHPDEIQSVLAAAKKWYPGRRIVAVFQPHTFSRTKVLFKEFSEAFVNADTVLLMDIYASARETDNLGATSQILADEIRKHHRSVFYTGGFEGTIDWIKNHKRRKDLILTIGAGSIFHIHKDLTAILDK